MSDDLERAAVPFDWTPSPEALAEIARLSLERAIGAAFVCIAITKAEHQYLMEALEARRSSPPPRLTPP